MDNKVPCGICSEPISSSCRRYGGRACNSCAAFFIRVIRTKQSFNCIGINNECLKSNLLTQNQLFHIHKRKQYTYYINKIKCLHRDKLAKKDLTSRFMFKTTTILGPSKLGKGCQRCRYDKCIEIGMSTNGMLEKEAETISETAMNPLTTFGTIIDSILTDSMKFPELLQAYLNGTNNSWLFANSFSAIHGAPKTQNKEKITFLKYFFTKFPITQNEFPAFIHLLICKLKLQHLQIEEQLKIQALQNAAFEKINSFNVPENRLIELTNLAEHFLNAFYVFC